MRVIGRLPGIVVLIMVGGCTVDRASVVSAACADAFAAAARVDEYHDRHEDLFPAYSACTTVEEWVAADGLHPNAIDGVEPVRYAMTVCANNQAELGQSPICQAVNAPPPTDIGPQQAPPALSSSGQTGLLGAPLPAGAELIERTPGDAAAGRDPLERYSISATTTQLGAFFNREMPAAGWAKDGTSTETALFFSKGRLMIGVLMNRDGGTFTLMGS